MPRPYSPRPYATAKARPRAKAPAPVLAPLAPAALAVLAVVLAWHGMAPALARIAAALAPAMP